MKVGDNIYSYGKLNRETGKYAIVEHTITKVGKKYIYCDGHQIYIDTMKDKNKYTSVIFYRSKNDIMRNERIKCLCDKLKTFFWNHTLRSVPLETLEKLNEIIKDIK